MESKDICNFNSCGIAVSIKIQYMNDSPERVNIRNHSGIPVHPEYKIEKIPPSEPDKPEDKRDDL